MRTYNRADWEAALQAWDDGQFSREWREFRHAAAMRGMIYPPEGTKWDSWEDDEPSQRAILIRAIRETPTMLMQAIANSRSWGDVIGYVIRRRDDLRAELDARERLIDFDAPTHRQAVMSLGAILERLDDSRGVKP